MKEKDPSLLTLLIFLILSAFVLGAGYAFFLFQRSELRTSRFTELESIADLKVKGIIQWRRDLLRDAGFFGAQAAMTLPAAKMMKQRGDRSAQEAVAAFAKTVSRSYGYRGARLYAPAGRSPIFAFPDRIVDHPCSFYDTLPEAFTGDGFLSDLYLCEKDGRIGLNLMIPVAAQDTESPGYFVLEIDPEIFLYPFIQTWPTASSTGESLLIKRDGGDVLYLNELRFKRDSAMRMRIPIGERADLPAAQALLGRVGPFEGVDYRGKRVIAWLRPIPDTEWLIVVKMDTEEAFSPIVSIGILIAAAVVFFIFCAAFSAFVLWRRRQALLELRANRAEMEKLAIAGRFDYLSRYANDAILLADESLSILEANDSARTLYGYERDELIGKKLNDLASDPLPFYENGALRAPGEGKGYRFETRRLRKDGSEVWVEASARTFRMNGRQYVQEIVRDVSEAKRAREEILTSIKEKEVLLRELHHRTKNNMQVISSLLLLQAGEARSEELNRSYQEMVGRIKSMALVHEKLYQSSNLSNLDLCAYVKELSDLIVKDLCGSGVELKVETPREPVPVLLDIAVPCGLVLNELLTNTFKHAFVNGQEKRVIIILAVKDTNIELSVTDNGRGLPPGFDVREHGHMGWQTILAIVESQLGGSVDVRSGEGTTVAIRFTTDLFQQRV